MRWYTLGLGWLNISWSFLICWKYYSYIGLTNISQDDKRCYVNDITERRAIKSNLLGHQLCSLRLIIVWVQALTPLLFIPILISTWRIKICRLPLRYLNTFPTDCPKFHLAVGYICPELASFLRLVVAIIFGKWWRCQHSPIIQTNKSLNVYLGILMENQQQFKYKGKTKRFRHEYCLKYYSFDAKEQWTNRDNDKASTPNPASIINIKLLGLKVK